MKPIGVIRSPFTTKEKAPIQGAYSPESEGRIEIFPEYEDGLKDIETFSHLIIFYTFDRAGEMKLVRSTFLDDEPHGVFASRHPCRPNSIGLTVVRLNRRIDNILEISGVDVLDKTPLIDLKPYIPRFDSFPEANEGWATSKGKRPKPPGRE